VGCLTKKICLKTKLMKFWKILLAFLFTIVLLGFARRVTSVRSPHETVEKTGILIDHYTVPKKIGEGDAQIPVKVIGTKEVKLYYKIEKGEFQAVDMNPKEGESDVFVASIPHHKKGTKAWYYVEAQKQIEDKKLVVSLPDKNSPNFEPILLKFEGYVPPYIIFSHVFFNFAAVFFSALAIFSAVDLKRGKSTLKKSVLFSLFTFILLFIGFLLVGSALNYFAFGVLWEAFPFGSDVTDNKSQIVLLFWLVTLFLVKGTIFGKNPSKNLVCEKTYSTMVIISFAVTVVMYLIPHSINF
jgi:hypothetical protein